MNNFGLIDWDMKALCTDFYEGTITLVTLPEHIKSVCEAQRYLEDLPWWSADISAFITESDRLEISTARIKEDGELEFTGSFVQQL